MENLFLIALFATIVYFMIKFIEMKYLEEEMKPLKVIVREGLIVFVSTILASYGFMYSNSYVTDLLEVITETKVGNKETPQIFTDNPGF
jgi:hypothetical protein